MAWRVIDANLSISQAIETSYSIIAKRVLVELLNQGHALCAPALWEYEVVSAIRKAAALDILTQDEANMSLVSIFRLGVQRFDPSLEVHHLALHWASVLGHTAAYDVQYLALADTLDAEFWTADHKLADAVRNLGIERVRYVMDEVV